MTIGLDDDLYIDEEQQMMRIVFRQPPIIPLNIYKALVKIGLSLLPPDFDTFNKRTFAWLLNADESIDFIQVGFMTTLKRGYVKHPAAELYRANHLRTKDEEFPEYTLILRFANQVFQIYLPFSEELLNKNNGKRKLCIELMPPMAYDIWDESSRYLIKYFAFTDQKIKGDQTLQFSFQDITRSQIGG